MTDQETRTVSVVALNMVAMTVGTLANVLENQGHNAGQRAAVIKVLREMAENIYKLTESGK